MGLIVKNKYSDYFCPRPFYNAEIFSNRIYLCCPQWLDVYEDKLLEKNFYELWNSAQFQAVRSSILDGSFKYCNAEYCDVLYQRDLYLKKDFALQSPYFRKIIAENLTRVDLPTQIDLAYDRTCNLKCPCCPTVETASEYNFGDLAAVRYLHKKIFKESTLLKQIKTLILCGIGDPFANKTYREFLQETAPTAYPDLKIMIMTNGLLLNRPMWDSLKMKPAIESVYVSIDAATAATYHKNRGGDFRRLLNNLEFISKLRENHEISRYEWSFIPQQNNFSEMKDFVLLAKKYQVDSVVFLKLRNLGAYQETQKYLQAAIDQRGHPEHQYLVETLKDPIFTDPMVNLGALAKIING